MPPQYHRAHEALHDRSSRYQFSLCDMPSGLDKHHFGPIAPAGEACLYYHISVLLFTIL